jgi:endonuclease/exonuclease/phosphatase family metal-dependent hydrolase
MACAKRTLTLLIALLGACGDDASPQAVDLAIESYNVGLAGSFVNFEAERRPAILSALATNPSDVVCVQEAWRQSDKDMIKAAAATRFPHAASMLTDLSTPVDPVTSDCEIAPAPTMPPCADAEVMMRLDAALTCLQNSCSTVPGSADGFTTTTDCAQTACGAPAAGLLLGGPAALQCFGCLAPQLPVESFASMRNLCTTEINAGLAFRGENGLMILSRFPLSNTKMTVLPGTWNRRIVLQSTVTLENGTSVDVYCNHTSAIFDGLAFPYTGRYGCGKTGAEGWAQEQKTQSQKLIEVVGASSATRPAVILGDFNSSRAAPGVEAEAPENLDLLTSAFTLAAPPSFTPVCTLCPDNNVAGAETPPVWIDHIFVKNIPLSAVKSLERTYTERTVTVAGQPGPVNLSDHYGVRAVITITPPASK